MSLPDEEEQKTWRIQREIPLSLVIFLVSQMVISLVALGAVVHELSDFRSIKNVLYTRSDAAKEREIIETLIEANGVRGLECERRLSAIEDRLEKHTDRDRYNDLRRLR